MNREKAEIMSSALNRKGIKVYAECPVKCRYPDSCNHWILNTSNISDEDKKTVNEFIKVMES